MHCRLLSGQIVITTKDNCLLMGGVPIAKGGKAMTTPATADEVQPTDQVVYELGNLHIVGSPEDAEKDKGTIVGRIQGEWKTNRE